MDPIETCKLFEPINFIKLVPDELLLSILNYCNPSSLAMLYQSCNFLISKRDLFQQACVLKNLNVDTLSENISVHVAINLQSLSYIKYLIDNKYSVCIESEFIEIIETDNHEFITSLIDPVIHSYLLSKHIKTVLKKLNTKTAWYFLSKINYKFYYNKLIERNRFDLIQLVTTHTKKSKQLFKSENENYNNNTYHKNIAIYKYMVDNGLFVSRDHLVKAVCENSIEHVEYMKSRMLKTEFNNALKDIKSLDLYPIDVSLRKWLSEHNAIRKLRNNIPKSFSQVVYLASINKFDNIVNFLDKRNNKIFGNWYEILAQLSYYSCIFDNYLIVNYNLVNNMDIEVVKFIIELMDEPDSIVLETIELYFTHNNIYPVILDKYTKRIALENKMHIIEYYCRNRIYIDFSHLLEIYLCGNIKMYDYICKNGTVAWNESNNIFRAICENNNICLIKKIIDRIDLKSNDTCSDFLTILFKYSSTEIIKKTMDYAGSAFVESNYYDIIRLIFRYKNAYLLKYLFNNDFYIYIAALFSAYENGLAAAEYAISRALCTRCISIGDIYDYSENHKAKKREDFIKWFEAKNSSSQLTC